MLQISHELDFAEPFTNPSLEVPELEALDAAIAFRSGVDDLFLDHAGSVTHHTDDMNSKFKQAADFFWLNFKPARPTKILHYTDVGKLPDRPVLRIWVHQSHGVVDSAPEDSAEVQVLIIEKDDDRDVRSIGYFLPSNGKKVIRHEGDNPHELFHGNWTQQLGELMLSYVGVLQEEVVEEMYNQELAELSGQNDRPVGPKEITSLLALLSKSNTDPPVKV